MSVHGRWVRQQGAGVGEDGVPPSRLAVQIQCGVSQLLGVQAAALNRGAVSTLPALAFEGRHNYFKHNP